MKYLTIEQVIKFHDLIIYNFGGAYGIRDKNLLESALQRPQLQYYNCIYEKACVLLESLALNHAFIDGNKRTSFFATDTFLRLNGIYIDCDNKKTHDYWMELFKNNLFKKEHIYNWLIGNIYELNINQKHNLDNIFLTSCNRNKLLGELLS